MLAALTVGALSVMTSCGGTAKTAVSTNEQALQNSRWSRVVKNPLFHRDTDEYWFAVGEYTGKPNAQWGDITLRALKNAQNQIYAKMAHSYQGLIEDYSRSLGNDEKGDEMQEKYERGGKQKIQQIVNNTDSWDEAEDTDDKGFKTKYVVIRISKKETARQVVKHLTENEKGKILEDADNFEKKLNETFKNSNEE